MKKVASPDHLFPNLPSRVPARGNLEIGRFSDTVTPTGSYVRSLGMSAGLPPTVGHNLRFALLLLSSLPTTAATETTIAKRIQHIPPHHRANGTHHAAKRAAHHRHESDHQSSTWVALERLARWVKSAFSTEKPLVKKQHYKDRKLDVVQEAMFYCAYGHPAKLPYRRADPSCRSALLRPGQAASGPLRSRFLDLDQDCSALCAVSLSPGGAPDLAERPLRPRFSFVRSVVTTTGEIVFGLFANPMAPIVSPVAFFYSVVGKLAPRPHPLHR